MTDWKQHHASEADKAGDQLDQIADQMQRAHDLRREGLRGGLKGRDPASMVQVGQVLWLVDEVARLRRIIKAAAKESS